MLSEELKNLVSELGTLIVVEDNRPKFVVMSYDKMKRLIHKSVDNSEDFPEDINEAGGVSAGGTEAEEAIDRLNQEILRLKEEAAEREKELAGE